VSSVAVGVLLNSFNRVSGLPPVPKPPTAMVAPVKFGTEARASLADSTTLLLLEELKRRLVETMGDIRRDNTDSIVEK
jgi:hypothetical protein